MKYKTWLKISFYSVLFGWFPFMWIAVWASWNREIGLYVLLLGLFFCFSGSILISLLKHEDLFKSIDELEAEREKYYEARKKLERKILEL